jgi:pimeloyl-ACP methyl ester carboxylesterase
VNTLFYRDLHEVILVGWSYAGMPISGAAERVPERIKHVVHLDAVIPFDGESRMDLFTPELRAWLEGSVRVHGGGGACR